MCTIHVFINLPILFLNLVPDPAGPYQRNNNLSVAKQMGYAFALLRQILQLPEYFANFLSKKFESERNLNERNFVKYSGSCNETTSSYKWPNSMLETSASLSVMLKSLTKRSP